MLAPARIPFTWQRREQHVAWPKAAQHEKAPVRLHPGRLAVLVLGFVAASFFVAPLRAFFAQQDRYQREVVALAQARAQNESRPSGDHGHREYVTRQAREEFQLVPRGMQAFVIKGLPQTDDQAQAVAAPKSPRPSSPTPRGPLAHPAPLIGGSAAPGRLWRRRTEAARP